jgi:RNA polymerase sigma-70 factor, ECF subfamily
MRNLGGNARKSIPTSAWRDAASRKGARVTGFVLHADGWARRLWEGNPNVRILRWTRDRRPNRIRNLMVGAIVADSATETNDLDAGLADEAAVEQTLIDKLVGAAVGGDSAARDQLIAELYPLVLRYCRNRLGRSDSLIGSADDVAQEVCLAVVAALRKYVISGRSFRSFVYGIAANKVADAFRAMGRNRTDATAEVPDGPVLDDGPEQRLLDGELAEQLAGLLQLLTPRQREVLVLRIAVGLSAEETAEAIGSTPGAVRVTQHRALNHLRALISPPDGDSAIDLTAARSTSQTHRRAS